MATETIQNYSKTDMSSGIATFKRSPRNTKHQIQTEVSAVPAAGVLVIRGRAFGATLYNQIASIDLTGVGADLTKLETLIEGSFDSMQWELTTAVTAGKTASLYITSF